MDRKRRLWAFRHTRQKSRIDDARNFHPHAQEIAHFRLSVLKAYHKEISKRERPKGETIAEIIALYNAGLILPDILRGKPKFLSRGTIYNWNKAYREGGFLALIPKYRWKQKPGAAAILIKPLRTKKIMLPGPPRRRSKYELLPEIRRQWGSSPLTYPIHLIIFYGIGIRKRTKMPRRMKMLRGEISHVGTPNLDNLNSFIVDCMTGIVFKDHSQIVEFHCAKRYVWYSKTVIYIRALPG